MNSDTRKLIDEKTPGLLRQASATLSVNKMVKVSAPRIILPLNGRNIEIVYYKAQSSNAPLIIGLHSGGWLFGGCALNDKMWLRMAEEMDVNIASVGYRMAPKYKWRDSLADAYDSTMYLYEHHEEFGFDPQNISLFGPSAGGNMAAALCLKADGNCEMRFKHLILLYPLLDLYTEPSLKGSEHYGGLSAYVMNEQHIMPGEEKLSLVSPVFAGIDELKNFPDTICITCENDALKHEGKAFTDKLNQAGIHTLYYEAPGMSHCFFELGYRNKLTEFEKEFIGEKGVAAFDSGLTKAEAENTLNIIKKEFKK